eukprot:TRINITY_DN657_c0_g2_i3.p1 TRINITY_DN657_c0_g2~~TRINITY_DN657_c0_g2_i3.p1  ORF type:complete len:405 (+),score=96.95 TRINITY_DN657_c0_g2_i3:89-1303(+)
MAAKIQELLGDRLLTQDGEKSTAEALSGAAAIGLYFSAHWCPPCRGFTPKLAEMYKSAFLAKGMRIIFVSSDRDEASFKEYFGEQPWLALPYDRRDVKESLSKKFKVRGIPSFVILDAEGKTITTEGRAAVSKDPTGEHFPWTPPTAAEKAAAVLKHLGPDLLAKTGGKAIGLYFSAHWCPPCRGFTPKLADFYRNGLKDKMEIVFVSSDRDQKSFDEYFAEMPWLALPFEKRTEKEALSEAFGVSGIPSFIVIKPDGTVITQDGRSKVMSDPSGKDFPDAWLPQPFNDVNDDPSDLNDEKCVLALGNDASMCEAVRTVAEEYYEKAGRDLAEMPLRFFKAPAGNVGDQIVKLTQLEGNRLVLMDIPEDGAFYVCEAGQCDAASVKNFIADVLAGKVERKQLQR